MKNGIRSAWQSGRSPSQNSIDEASAASPIIRQLKNPGVARLKCVVLGLGYPCYVHSSSVRDKDEARATPQVRSAYCWRYVSSLCRALLLVVVSSVLENTFGNAPTRGNTAPAPRFYTISTVPFGLAFAVDISLWACSSQFSASISLICSHRPWISARKYL